jgi:TPR repeat protein
VKRRMPSASFIKATQGCRWILHEQRSGINWRLHRDLSQRRSTSGCFIRPGWVFARRDLPSAEKWFQLGAKLHNPMALYSLAQLYSADSEPHHDFGKAAAPLHQAVESGYVPAIYTLGLLLRVHPEIKQADGESKALLERAASGGEWRASVLLGISARDGMPPRHSSTPIKQLHQGENNAESRTYL